jgi:hypothetical protein
MALLKGVEAVAPASSSEKTSSVFYYGSTENCPPKSMKRITMFKNLAEN